VLDDPLAIAATAGVFLLAGVVKGVIGMGLPTVCLALLILFLDLPSTMALLLVPSFVTNLWQASVGGHAAFLLRRLWPFLLPAALLVWVGGLTFAMVDHSLMSLTLGLLLIVYAAVNLEGKRPEIRPGKERWMGPLLGAVNGLLTGMTGSFVVPGVLFLQAIGLARDQLVQAMGILFTISTVALAVSLGGNKFLTADLGLASLAGVVPALAGMVIGQRLRCRLSEERFRRVFFWSILALGLVIAARASS
jgi:uncharacterized membrane protein YfcA